MIFHRTLLSVSDNSGAQKAMCIKVLRSSKSRGAIGSKVIFCIKKYIPNKKVKKGEVRSGVVIRQSFPLRRRNGMYIKFFENSVVLVDKKHNPISSRILGPVTQELRFYNYMKIMSMAPCSL